MIVVMELLVFLVCDDIESLKNVVGEDEEVRDLRAQLAEVKVWYKLGCYEELLDVFVSVVE